VVVIKLSLLNQLKCLNISAANSLLKTLEEPTENVIIILVSNQPAMLTATIYSHYQQIIFKSEK
jgi:DNA polymerase-3 subunit delta'